MATPAQRRARKAARAVDDQLHVLRTDASPASIALADSAFAVICAALSEPGMGRSAPIGVAMPEILERLDRHVETHQSTEDAAPTEDLMAGLPATAIDDSNDPTTLIERIGERPPSSVTMPWGVVSTEILVQSTAVWLVTRGYQLGIDPPRSALSTAVRGLAACLAEAHPGSAIEVRIPPVTAIQIGARGSSTVHTRGTPPNVVEMDPTTWVHLATGIETWRKASDQARISYSGAHALDVATMLPMPGMNSAKPLDTSSDNSSPNTSVTPVSSTTRGPSPAIEATPDLESSTDSGTPLATGQGSGLSAASGGATRVSMSAAGDADHQVSAGIGHRPSEANPRIRPAAALSLIRDE